MILHNMTERLLSSTKVLFIKQVNGVFLSSTNYFLRYIFVEIFVSDIQNFASVKENLFIFYWGFQLLGITNMHIGKSMHQRYFPARISNISYCSGVWHPGIERVRERERAPHVL